MRWKLLAGGIFGGVSLAAIVVVAVVLLVVLAAVGGVVWFFVDDDPLLYYDARPATVDEGTLQETGYQRVNDTAFESEFTPIPEGKPIVVRTWATLYVDPGAERADGNASFDPANASMVSVFSTSALQLGPVAFHPLVYASDPGLLDASGGLIDELETWLPEDVASVTDVDVESTRDVELLGQETQMTTFTGELVLENDAGNDTVRVRMYLARTVKDGELVIVLGLGPPDERTGDEFASMVEGVEMGEWGAEPDVVVDEGAGNESAGRAVATP